MSASFSALASSGSSAQSEARPYFRMLAMRFMSTVVLPLPAPARMSRGPSVAMTASRCLSFSRGKFFAMTRFRAAMYFFVKSSMGKV